MIYLDNSATTKISPQALEIYTKYSTEQFFNSAALYSAAGVVLSDINKSRSAIAAGLNIQPSQIFFTSGGTESNNLAIRGFLSSQKRGRIICGGGEHPSVYNVFKHIQESGVFDVVFAPLNKYGAVDIEQFSDLVTKDTIFVSVMHVSSETGAINDIDKIADHAKSISPDCIVHSDGVQAYGKIPIDLQRSKCDLYSISAHKHHGPKGIGALYVAPNIKLKPLLYGGGQESNLRSGTHNTPAIMAYGIAAEHSLSNLKANIEYLYGIKEHLWTTLSAEVVDILLNSETTMSGVPNILSVSIKNIPAEVVVSILESKGIFVGTGSACSSKKGHSRIHQAMGMSKEYSMGTLRFSFSEYTTASEVETAAKETIAAVRQLYKVCKK